jgi:hypothetical protein
LSSVLMKDQYVKVYLHISHSLTFCGLKSIQTITPAQTWILDITCIVEGFRLTPICHSLEDQPASIHGRQRRKQPRWMIGYSHVGQYFPFLERNCCVSVYFFLIVTFCTAICNCNTVNEIVCPTFNINQCTRKLFQEIKIKLLESALFKF